MAEVRVHDDQYVAARRLEAVQDGSGEAELARPVDDLDVVPLAELLGEGARPVGAVVIDDDGLDLDASARAGVVGPAEELLEVVLLVVGRDDY
jgi:hypothetical protein